MRKILDVFEVFLGIFEKTKEKKDRVVNLHRHRNWKIQSPKKCNSIPPPKGPSRTVFSMESGSVVFNYSVVNLLRMVIHYSK